MPFKAIGTEHIGLVELHAIPHEEVDLVARYTSDG
jgi:hypothetical protein